MTRYTLISQDRRFKQIPWQDHPCQARGLTPGWMCGKVAEFDAPTYHGPWAYLCGAHAEMLVPEGSRSGYHFVRSLNG